MKDPKFLFADKGLKETTLKTHCQLELAKAINKLSGGTSKSTYIREILIEHVRKEIKAGRIKKSEIML